MGSILATFEDGILKKVIVQITHSDQPIFQHLYACENLLFVKFISLFTSSDVHKETCNIRFKAQLKIGKLWLIKLQSWT